MSERIDEKNVDTELAGLAQVLNQTFDRLQEAFDRRSQFTADASHELRTPLAVMRSQAELTLSRPREKQEYREALEACLRAAERMTGLVDRLLTLARSDAAGTNIERTNFDFDRLVAEVIAEYEPLARQKGIVLKADIDPAPVSGDADALAQVVGNLIGNAIQYNRPKGVVRVQLTQSPLGTKLAVVDTGVGISNTDRPHVFERFYRVDQARSRSSGGSGLGLAICKAIVESHQGTIGFDSVEGEGSTFWVMLPIATTRQEIPIP
jgi:heavy metal sensor kinase